jgi:GNAT superfamily N-acetyltransferase
MDYDLSKKPEPSDEVGQMVERLLRIDELHQLRGLHEQAAALLLRERENTSRAWQQGYDAKGRAVTDADYSWKPRAEQAEARAAALAKELRTIVAAYDAYRGRGVAPAPNEYQTLVRAINAARAIAKDGSAK